MERFWDKVKIGAPNECWEWSAGKQTNGYGTIYHEGKTQLSHRVSWQLHNGKIPDGLHVLHKCDTPSCVNPRHLFLGTQNDNMIDKTLKNRTFGRYGRKEYVVIFPDNHEEQINNLKSFCRLHRLNAGNMVEVAKGKRRHHKGFRVKYA